MKYFHTMQTNLTICNCYTFAISTCVYECKETIPQAYSFVGILRIHDGDFLTSPNAIIPFGSTNVQIYSSILETKILRTLQANCDIS